jgi:hypothetical protein
VKKEGRENVLVCDKTMPLYWLKKQYEKLIDHAQEARIKKIPLKMAGSGENGEFVMKVTQVNPETDGRNIPIARFSVPSLQ